MRGYTRDDLTLSLQRWALSHGRVPSQDEWAAARHRPTLGTLLRHFGSWSNAVRAAGLDPHDHRYDVRVAATPFIEWLRQELVALASNDFLFTNENSTTPPTRELLAQRLGISTRGLGRYLASQDGSGHPVASFSRDRIEEMLGLAGAEIYDVYPELRDVDDVALEPEVYCSRCRERTTPIFGVCPWCETHVGDRRAAA